jgi:alpha-D-ribose 1-methylphosphonate 5-triphosphate synthase subunit PhnG
MAVLARASLQDIEALSAHIQFPDFNILKPAEICTLMIESRAGGTGTRFNTGEATVTQCVIQMGDKLGYSYALGRDKNKAVLSAKLDAMLQSDEYHVSLLETVITPLVKKQIERKEAISRRVAPTKVEFFTMVRGEG